MNVLPMSKIHVVCPNPANVPTILYDSVPKERMHENLWIADKAAYDTCTVDTSRNSNRLLRMCDNPLQLTYYTLVFQMFSATATGLEFQPGNTYYLIGNANTYYLIGNGNTYYYLIGNAITYYLIVHGNIYYYLIGNRNTYYHIGNGNTYYYLIGKANTSYLIVQVIHTTTS